VGCPLPGSHPSAEQAPNDLTSLNGAHDGTGLAFAIRAMLSLIKRLLFPRQPEMTYVPGDLATGDWAPVPATAAAQSTDVIDWLETSEPAAPPPRARRTTIRRVVDVMKRISEHLTEEEQRIIKRQMEP